MEDPTREPRISSVRWARLLGWFGNLTTRKLSKGPEKADLNSTPVPRSLLLPGSMWSSLQLPPPLHSEDETAWEQKWENLERDPKSLSQDKSPYITVYAERSCSKDEYLMKKEKKLKGHDGNEFVEGEPFRYLCTFCLWQG